MKLATTVQVLSPQGEPVELGPDSALPDWAIEVIDNPAAWEGGVIPKQGPAGHEPGQADPTAAATPEASVPGEKPAGNASTEAWLAYARSQGVTDDELAGMTRDDIRVRFSG